MSKVYFVVFLLSTIWNIFVFMVDHEPQYIKPAIVKWLELLEVNEKHIPTFLYSIHSSEQIPYFYYIDKIFTLVLIFIFIHFIYNKVKNYYTFKCLYHWLFKFISIIKNIKKPVFISFHDAIAKIIQQLDINQLWKDYRFDDNNVYPYLKYRYCDRIESVELITIFTLIREEKLILYAHKIIDSWNNCIDTSNLPLQQIPKDFFNTCDIYHGGTWMDHYNTIRNPYDGREYYVNVCMKREELENFIKIHKLAS